MYMQKCTVSTRLPYHRRSWYYCQQCEQHIQSVDAVNIVRYLHDRVNLRGKVLHHYGVLAMQLLSDGGAVDEIGKALKQSKPSPQRGAIVERLGQDGRQPALQALH